MRPFRIDDIAEMNGWLSEHEQGPVPPWALPEFGLFEPGVAAGFLYETDSGLALLEGYSSNPRSDAAVRSKALDDITEGLLEAAHDRGFRRVLAICQVPAIERRAERHGFKTVGAYTLMGRMV